MLTLGRERRPEVPQTTRMAYDHQRRDRRDIEPRDHLDRIDGGGQIVERDTVYIVERDREPDRVPCPFNPPFEGQSL